MGNATLIQKDTVRDLEVLIDLQFFLVSFLKVFVPLSYYHICVTLSCSGTNSETLLEVALIQNWWSQSINSLLEKQEFVSLQKRNLYCPVNNFNCSTKLIIIIIIIIIFSGIDGISNFLLKDCASVLAEPLCFLFNLILKKSTFLSIWKKSVICPIVKTWNSTEINFSFMSFWQGTRSDIV